MQPWQLLHGQNVRIKNYDSAALEYLSPNYETKVQKHVCERRDTTSLRLTNMDGKVCKTTGPAHACM